MSIATTMYPITSEKRRDAAEDTVWRLRLAIALVYMLFLVGIGLSVRALLFDVRRLYDQSPWVQVMSYDGFIFMMLMSLSWMYWTKQVLLNTIENYKQDQGSWWMAFKDASREHPYDTGYLLVVGMILVIGSAYYSWGS